MRKLRTAAAALILLPALAAGQTTWVDHDRSVVMDAQDVIQDMRDRYEPSSDRFFNDTVKNNTFEHAASAIGSVTHMNYYYDRQGFRALYDKWLYAMTNAAQPPGLERPYVFRPAPRVMEGVDNEFGDASARGLMTNSINVLASSSAQWGLDPSNVLRAIRAYYNVYDNMDIYYPGATNWMHQETVFEANWWGSLDPYPKFGAWLFSAPLRTSHTLLYGGFDQPTIPHDAATGAREAFTLNQSANYYGPNHIGWAHSDDRGGQFMISNGEIWTQRCLDPISGGAGDKPAELCPSNILYDGVVRAGVNALEHWGWESPKASGDVMGWNAGADSMAWKYKQLAYFLALNRRTLDAAVPNQRLNLLAGNAEKVLEEAYCARVAGDTIPVYGGTWESDLMDSALLMYVYYRNAVSPSCDVAAMNIIPPTTTTHAMAAKLAEDEGDFAAADSETEKGLELYAAEMAALKADWEANHDAATVSAPTSNGYGALKACSPGVHEDNGFTARFQPMMHDIDVAYHCVKSTNAETIWRVDNKSGMRLAWRVAYMWGKEGDLRIDRGQDANNDRVLDSSQEGHDIDVSRGVINEDLSIPPDWSGLVRVSYRAGATEQRDYAQLGNPAIDPDHRESYSVTQLPNGMYQITVRVHNLGLSLANFEVHLLANDHVTPLQPHRSLRVHGRTGANGGMAMASWQIDDPADVGKVIVKAEYDEEPQQEITAYDNELVIRPYAPYPRP